MCEFVRFYRPSLLAGWLTADAQKGEAAHFKVKGMVSKAGVQLSVEKRGLVPASDAGSPSVCINDERRLRRKSKRYT